jgi:hypothetical protein
MPLTASPQHERKTFTHINLAIFRASQAILATFTPYARTLQAILSDIATLHNSDYTQ